MPGACVGLLSFHWYPVLRLCHLLGLEAEGVTWGGGAPLLCASGVFCRWVTTACKEETQRLAGEHFIVLAPSHSSWPSLSGGGLQRGRGSPCRWLPGATAAWVACKCARVRVCMRLYFLLPLAEGWGLGPRPCSHLQLPSSSLATWWVPPVTHDALWAWYPLSLFWVMQAPAP